MTLTTLAVKAAKPRERAYKLADRDGLYLFVSPAGGKSWRANFTEAGKQKTRTYGRFPELDLAAAREAHRKVRGGQPAPADARRRPPAPTFGAVAHEWLLTHLPGLSNPKHRGQVQGTLETYAYPTLKDRPIADITRAELVAVVKAVGDKVETAHRVAGRVTAVFDYAQDAGIIERHPASHLTRVLPAKTVKNPMASVAPAEAGELLRAIDTYPDLVTRLGLHLVAHTFVRVSEALGMRWDELREDGAIWVVPAERVKGKAEKRLPHVVPLSKQARAILARLREINGDTDLVLDSPARPGHPLSENTLLFALYRLGYRGRMTVHGFRALASTVLNEQSDFPQDVIERQLQHKETDAVRAAYNRAQYLSQRRELMEWWSTWLEHAAAGRTPASGRTRRS